MSITRELRKWVESHTTNSLFMSYPPQHEVCGTAESLKAVADEIDAEHKRLTDKAHADGEKSAMKQVRSRSVDYKKGYEQAMADVERTKDERTKQDGAGSSMFEQGSSITDELRRYAAKIEPVYRGDLERIADRIDEQHEKAVLIECTRGYNAGFDAASAEVESADELRERIEREYVKLPVDADGEIIHLGDRLEHINGEFTVNDMTASIDGLWRAWDSRNGHMVLLAKCHHVQPDSWERIIEDAISESGWEQPKEYEIDFEDSKGVRNRFVAELVERCKRLAGDAE